MLGPSLRRPRGPITPRGPGLLGILLVLTLGAMFYWGGARAPSLSSPPPAPADGAHDAPATTPGASPLATSDAG